MANRKRWTGLVAEGKFGCFRTVKSGINIRTHMCLFQLGSFFPVTRLGHICRQPNMLEEPAGSDDRSLHKLLPI